MDDKVVIGGLEPSTVYDGNDIAVHFETKSTAAWCDDFEAGGLDATELDTHDSVECEFDALFDKVAGDWDGR